MTHDELRDLYELYVLGVLEPEERGEIDEHLAGTCFECAQGIRRAMVLNAAMAELPDALQPPRRLRRRVLASVGIEPSANRMWLLALAAATCCLAIGIVVIGLESTRSGEELSAARARLERNAAELTRNSTELARMRAAMQILEEPETRQVIFAPRQRQQPPVARFFLNPRRGVVLFASNLPPLPAGKTFELWIIPKSGAPVPAGLFQSDAQGSALYLRPEPVEIGTSKALAVTVEPSAGSPAPTTTPFIVAGLTE